MGFILGMSIELSAKRKKNPAPEEMLHLTTFIGIILLGYLHRNEIGRTQWNTKMLLNKK